jgi:hypothetical protein
MWNRERDRFQEGPTFKGRIFVDRSDISPDGRLLIYFAMGGVAWAIPATGGTWTAISRLPSLTAMTLWGQGNTWSGGGMFTSNASYWLDADDVTFLIHDNRELRRESRRPAASRIEKAGWIKRPSTDYPHVFEKALPKGWLLRKIQRSFRTHLYQLEHVDRGCRLDFPQWEWADWDRKRLVWVEEGCLRTAAVGTRGLGTIRTLRDFNG